MEFRDALKLFRSEMGIAQADIAAALHVNISTIARWEQGRTVPNRSCGIALLDYAKRKCATKECIDKLDKALNIKTKQKLFNSKNSLFTVEHATISRLIDEAALPIYVCDLDTDEVVYANRAMLQQLGKSLDELSGKKCYECIMCKDKPCEFCHKSELVDDSFKGCDAVWPYSGEPFHIQGTLIQWNGRSAQVRNILWQHPSEELRQIGAASGSAFISDSKTAENTVVGERFLQSIDNEESFQQLKELFANINGGVSIVVYEADGAMRLAYANEHYYELFGYTKEQFLSELKDPHDTVYPSDWNSVAKTFSKVKETKQGATFRYRIVRRDKTIAHIRCNSSITAIDGLNGYALISILTDITESVQTEQQAIVSSRRLDAIMQNMNSAVTASIIKSDGTIEMLFTNDLHHQMLGYTKEQYDSEIKDPLQVVHPDDVAAVRDAILNLHRIGDVKEM